MEGELLNYGFAGVILAVFLAFAYKTLNRALEERDRAMARTEAMVQDMFTRVVPAITAATDAIKARAEHDNEVREVLVDIRRWFESHRPEP